MPLGLETPNLYGLGESKNMPIGPGVYLAAALGSTLLGGLFGGNDQQEMKPYTGNAAPQRTLEEALAAIKGFGANLERRGPAQLRSAVMPPPTQPVRVPGLGIQIGGGLGMDPALKDPSMLTGRGLGGPRGASLRSPSPNATSLDPNHTAKPRKPAGSSL
jgi:hypothetical protein